MEDVSKATGDRKKHYYRDKKQLMGFVKKYRFIIAVILPIVILVLIRQYGGDHFKSDAPKLAGPSVSLSNMISMDKAGKLPGAKLFVTIGGDINRINSITEHEVLNIKPDSVLNKDILSLIRKHKGPVFLVSDETEVSARLWMILSQMGCDNIFIITGDPDNEVLKFKFRPDTTIRPELHEINMP
jgi:hypothetical protein